MLLRNPKLPAVVVVVGILSFDLGMLHGIQQTPKEQQQEIAMSVFSAMRMNLKKTKETSEKEREKSKKRIRKEYMAGTATTKTSKQRGREAYAELTGRVAMAKKKGK